jgi:mannonate dehydratase
MMQKRRVESRIKLSVHITPEPSEDELLFASQLGATCVYTWLRRDQQDYEFLLHLRQKVENVGLVLYNVGSMSVAKSDKIHLGLPGRDEKIEEFKSFVRNLGRAGIHTTTFTWEPVGVWSSDPGQVRGAVTRRVDLDEMLKRPYTHGRAYTEEEIWANFEYFVERILPVAEEAHVRLALHPNDPPTPVLGGVPCLVHSFESYRRAFAIARSPYLGMEFCVGCWLEGGAAFGNLFQAIRHFHEQRKILIVHFRNVSSPLPHFVETFLDNGYMDMYQVMKVFCEIGYDGTMILDHTPKFASSFGPGTGTAYAIGYMRALIERAEAELNAE